MHYVGTTFTMKMNSNDKTLCDNIVNKQHINVLKLPQDLEIVLCGYNTIKMNSGDKFNVVIAFEISA